YIQWVLIYVTIYQVIFDQFIVSSEVKNMLQGTIDEPVAIIIVILPSFISIWIAVVLFRIRMEEL
ncbi:SA1002 family membrane protein, partial [Enterococcus faecalis]